MNIEKLTSAAIALTGALIALCLMILGAWTLLSGFVTAAMRLVPEAKRREIEKTHPNVAHLARAYRKVGADWIPAVREVLAMLTRSPYAPAQSKEGKPDERITVRQAAPPSNGSSRGFASHRTLQEIAIAGIGGVILAAVLLHLASCTGSAVQGQMRAADILAVTANEARPVWINAMETEATLSADATCRVMSDESCIQRRLDASRAVILRWKRVRDQWEIVRIEHDAYSTCLERANGIDGGTCSISALNEAVTGFRCELRFVGHPEADPLGAGAVTCPTPPLSFEDGGVR